LFIGIKYDVSAAQAVAYGGSTALKTVTVCTVGMRKQLRAGGGGGGGGGGGLFGLFGF